VHQFLFNVERCEKELLTKLLEIECYPYLTKRIIISQLMKEQFSIILFTFHQ